MNFDHPLVPLALDLGSEDPGVRLQAVKRLIPRLPDPGFLETLREHRLIYLLYRTMTQFPRKEVGEVPLLEELRREYLAGVRLYNIQEKETRILAELLAGVGVEVILLKGGDIRHRLYDDPACRPMSDLDVLISPADLEKVRTVLKGEGYTLKPWDLEPQPGFISRFDNDIAFATPSQNLDIDFHWGLHEVGSYYRLPYATLRARATVRDQQGYAVLVLTPEHLLMHLCLHTFDELETAGILKILDLDLALRRLPLDWALFLADAATFHLQGPLSRIFREMEKLRPQAVPAGVMERLAAYTPDWSEKLILRREAMSLLVASLAALWRYVPIRAWPAFLKGKLWPDADYIKANAWEFGNRAGYLRHLLRRARDET
jgi:hypothetical protein